MVKSLFISIEGPDGSGKTSLINQIAPVLREQLGERLVISREPGGNRIAEAIRNVILDHPEFTEMDSRTEALLFAAARRQHIVEVIEPALAQNKVVISDRYVDSSAAYQGGGRGIGIQNVEEMNRFATDGLMPDKTFYLDISPQIGLKRIMEKRSNEVNRLDKDELFFHEEVYRAYKEIINSDPQRFIIIDANLPIEQVAQNTLLEIRKAIQL